MKEKGDCYFCTNEVYDDFYDRNTEKREEAVSKYKERIYQNYIFYLIFLNVDPPISRIYFFLLA